ATRGQPIVDGTINGQHVGILIDTGASRSIVLRAAADRLGLVRYNARGSRLIGVGGESTVETVSVDELAIGSDVRRNWRVLVAGAFPSVVTKSQAAALGVTPETPGVIAGGCGLGLGQKGVESWLGPFDSFRIGDELIRDPRIGFADIWKFSTYKSASLIARRM